MHRCVECHENAQGRRCTACGAAILAGRYRISSLLSRSPHARVYSALTPEGVSVALKELSFALVPSVRQLEAFEREARALERIDHPAVPRFIEAFREGEGAEVRLYLAQQLVEGTSLQAMLPQHRFSEAEARDIARKVLLVLSDLHDAGVVHRDLKPANILKREDGSLALVDFGVARLPDRSRGTTVAGTFGFAAPEALAGVADVRSDLYALGATLVALLARRDPAEMLGPDLGLRIDGQLAISAELRAFLARLTARDRGLRYASAQEALAALDGPRRPPPPVRRPATLFTLMLAAVALAGVGLWRTRARASGKAAIPQVSAARTRRPIDGPLPPFIFPIEQGWTDLPGTFGGQVQARWHTSSGDCATLTLVRLSRFAHRASGRDREEVQFFATFGDEEDRCEGPATGTFFRLLDDTGRESVRFESRPIAGRGDEPLVFHAAFYAPAGSRRLHLVGGEFPRPQVEYALDLVANVVQEWRQ